MRQNALLRSDKGLRPAGTARRKPVSVVVPVQQSDDHFALRKGVRCAGVHLIVDLHGAEGLDDIDLIEATLRRAVDAARATLLHIHVHHFQPNGVSGVAVLAESHISIHSWPERNYAALDVFMCGNAEPDKCIPVLRQAFKPGRVAVFEIMVNTPSIAALIRDNKSFRIQSDIQTGAKFGMVTLDSFLVDKYLAGMIAREEVIAKAQDPTTVQAKLQELELAEAEQRKAA